MIKKVTLLTFGSIMMLSSLLISFSSFAGDKNKKTKSTKPLAEQIPLLQNAKIAELYLNMNYAYVPLSKNGIQLENGQLPNASQVGIYMITKDDYHFYFKKSNTIYQFVYAVKDNNIPLFDGFEYAAELKIPIGNQLFTFDMINGRPTDVAAEAVSHNNYDNVANTEIMQ